MDETPEIDIPWKTLIETAPDGLCVLDAEGAVRYANPAALELFGLSSPNGMPAAEWLAGLDDITPDQLAEMIEKGGQARVKQLERAYKHLLLKAESLDELGGTLLRVLRDYDAEAAQTTALLVHDLRLPLTSIMGYSKMLLTVNAESLDDMQRQFLNTIERNVRRLERNLSAAHDMTRIDRGQITLTFAAQSLSQIAVQILEELQPLVSEKRHQISVELPEDLPPARADAGRLKQIIHIVLDNAVKYTPPGGEIHLRGHCAGGFVQIDVQDNGLGISPVEQQQVFSKFFRGEDERVREHHGLGLNLYIARALTHLQGGRLWFESQLGGGSTFSFELPVSGTE
jgi:signal transduction histidine kinase